MTYRSTITLDSEAHAFLSMMGANNKSAFINSLLKEEKQRYLEQEILRANQEEAEDLEYRAALSDWDVTSSDGLPEDV